MACIISFITWKILSYNISLKHLRHLFMVQSYGMDHHAIEPLRKLLLHIIQLWNVLHDAMYGAQIMKPAGCNIVGVQIFKHLIAKRSVCFYYSMLKSKSPCIKPYQNFIRNRSLARSELDNLLRAKRGELAERRLTSRSEWGPVPVI